MRRSARTPWSVLLLSGISALAVFMAACGGSPSSPSTPSTVPTITTLPALAEMIADKTMGDANATNTVIVYSSFTCSHCADFHLQTFPQLKSRYIDAGKVKYVFRDFERNSMLDVHAAMLARCAGEARYFDVVDTLFRNQASWAGSGDQGLATLMRQVGMSQQVIDACLATTALSNAIIKSRDDAVNQFGVYATPTLIVNNDVIVGDVPLSTIEPHLH